jgi:peptidoglycan/LPS O-acetylase OafA/YrhL
MEPMKHPRLVWALATLVAAALAVPGVVLYAENPGVATSQLNSLLVLPLVMLVLYWLHRRLPLRVQWIGAWLVLLLGAGAYLLEPNDQSWQYGAMGSLPLLMLAIARQERRNHERGEDEPAYGGWCDGPWGPP